MQCCFQKMRFINGIEYNKPFLSKQFAMSADSFDIGFIFGEAALNSNVIIKATGWAPIPI